MAQLRHSYSAHPVSQILTCRIFLFFEKRPHKLALALHLKQDFCVPANKLDVSIQAGTKPNLYLYPYNRGAISHASFFFFSGDCVVDLSGAKMMDLPRQGCAFHATWCETIHQHLSIYNHSVPWKEFRAPMA